jgi:predicted aminopeptidase
MINIRLEMHIKFIFLISLTSCYSLKQTNSFFRVYRTRVPIETILTQENVEPKLKKSLKNIQKLKKIARDELGLNTDNSYEHVIKWPKNTPITHLIFAAYPHELKRKTWWFPFIGPQPYLGFFDRKDAEKQILSLQKKNFDTYLGGAKAFSLLGYLKDPILTSMIGEKHYQTVEIFLHEWTHRTVYLTKPIVGMHEFNENLAEFVEEKGTEIICQKHPEICELNLEEYKNMKSIQKKTKDQFRNFLQKTIQTTKVFFQEAQFKDLTDLENQKKEHYEKIESLAQTELKNNPYQKVFFDLNNAKLLSLSTYSNHFSDIEKVFICFDQNIKTLLNNLKVCLKTYQTKSIWDDLKLCCPKGKT